MKKFFLSVLTSLFVLFSFSQAPATTADKMLKHSGETLSVKVIKVGETTVTYKYPGEDAEQTIGKFAVASITYGTTGRVEKISDKIEVSGKNDWEKVEIVTDKAQVIGLKKGEEVRGKTSGFLSYNSAGTADKKATRKLKEAAAEMNAPFILLTSDKADNMGIKQSIKNGVAYSYK